jgi:hypothetical protein
MTTTLRRARQWAGVMLKEWRHYRDLLARDGRDYLALANRNERLTPAPDGSGYRCEWAWTSQLHAPGVAPSLGRRLLQRAMADFPVLRRAAPEATHATPECSFVIGHRGAARIPHLLATLESIAAQEGVRVECIVVEQDSESRLQAVLPSWVRLVRTPPPQADLPYCRSWALNVGAAHARGDMLVLHDGDMLVPAGYAAAMVAHLRRGHEVVNLKRFVFYLDRAHTEAVLAGRADLADAAPEAIVQNLEAGGSIGISREGFLRIGGMDESFVGWGGEDNEFWDRAQTLKTWPYASMPIVHLWHAPQPGKGRTEAQGQRLFHTLHARPVAERIARLAARVQGRVASPAVGESL